MRPGTRLVACVCTSLLLLAALAPAVRADVLPFGLRVDRVKDHAAELGDLAQSPTGDLWLLERGGTIRVFRDGKELASLSLGVDTACDGGLLDVAFPADHGSTGRAFVYLVASGGEVRVDTVVLSGDTLAREGTLLTIGTTSTGCRVGGGLAVGKDGKLYVATGDLENGSAAQDDGSLFGKVLRVNPDGTIPGDNPDPSSYVFSKGFRDGRDLAFNPNTTREGGTLYQVDVGDAADNSADEVNAVVRGGNHGWNEASGNSGGSYDDPLVSYESPRVTPVGIAALTTGALGADRTGHLVYACTADGKMREAWLTGDELAQFDHDGIFFDPEADGDGTPDTGCPRAPNAVAEENAGRLLFANTGDNPGVWMVWKDFPGPAEVSAPGSLVPLTVEKNGGNLVLGWERLPDRDVGRPSRNAGQRTEVYEVWEGTLPITDGNYDHTGILATDGTADGFRLKAEVTPGDGNRYYLVTAQGDNMEGSTGRRSDGDARPTGQDWCDTIGWGIQVGNCAPDFQNPVDGSPLKLVDYNPNSPTYMQSISIADFRGWVVRMDISADDCFWCNVQADYNHEIDQKYRARNFTNLTIFTKTYHGLVPYASPEECAAAISDWATRHNEINPVLCDVDMDGDGKGDVSMQYWHQDDCGGTPQNFFISQGNVIYDFKCGGITGATVEGLIQGEVDEETCE